MAFKMKSAILKLQARKALSLRDMRWRTNTKVDKYNNEQPYSPALT